MTKSISTKSVSTKAVLVAAVIFAMLFAWFTVRWQIGSMLADLTRPNDVGADRIADASIGMAPANGRGYWLAGSIRRGFFDQESIDSSVGFFAQGARVTPYNYRSWTELGRSYEQAGDATAAEAAFLKGTELAPAFAIPRWQIGNFYLRQGRTDDAARELRLAAEYDSPYREQVFGTVWNVLGSDPQIVERFAADKPDVYAALASFYANKNLPNEALEAWNLIAPEAEPRFRYRIEGITQSLFDKRSFIGALEFSRISGLEPNARVDTLTNGGFESQLRDIQSKPKFDWEVYRVDPKVEVARDQGTFRSGKSSLRVTFRGYGKPPLHSLQQMVAATPGTKFRLQYWIRTEGLRSGSMPYIEILNTEGALSAVSPPISVGTNEWQEVSIDFTVPDGQQGFLIRTNREPCPGECPIVGVLWFDDFQLTRH